MLGMPVGVAAVELAEEVEVAALLSAVDRGRRADVQQRRSLRSQCRSLETGGKKPVGPVCGSALRIGEFRQDDETREIGVLGAQSQVDPCPQCRITAEAIAGV